MENNLPKPQTNNGLPVPPSFPKPETALPLPELEIPAHANHGYTIKPSHPHHGFKWLKWLLLFFVITTFILIAALYMLLSNAVIMNNKQSQEQSSTVAQPTTIPAGCYYQQVQCIQAPCDPVLVCNTPQPTVATIDTSTWLTYTNPKLGISFKYPSTFAITPSSTTPGVIFSDKDRVSIVVNTYSVPTSTDIKQWITQQTVRLLPDNTRRSSIQGEINSYNLPGFVGYSFITISEETDKIIVLNNNGSIAWFALSGYETGSSYKDNPNAEQILDQILSTFQFITPSPVQSGAQISPVEAVIEGRG